MTTTVRRTTASVAVTAMLAASLPAPVSASEFSSVLALTDRQRVEQLLVEHRVEPVEAKARAAALTDDEARSVANQMDALPAGSGGAFVLVLYGLFAVLHVIAAVVQGGSRYNTRYRAP